MSNRNLDSKDFYMEIHSKRDMEIQFDGDLEIDLMEIDLNGDRFKWR